MMHTYPECCDKLMDAISEVHNIGKFYEISTWRCSSCESELVRRNAGSKEYLQALIDEHEERREGYD